MGMEGWRKLEARDEEALGRDDQDVGCAVSIATALDGHGSGKTAGLSFAIRAKRGCSSRQERAKRGATHPIIFLRE